MRKPFGNFFKVLVITMVIMFGMHQSFSQAYRVEPGTVSLRLDGSDDPVITDFLTYTAEKKQLLSIGTYFGSDNSGARTSWNSSLFKDFSLFYDPTATDSNFPIVATSGEFVGKIGDFQWKWKLNYRMAYPTVFDSTAYANGTNTDKYPVIIMMHGAGERADCWRGSCYHDNINSTKTYGGYKNLWNNDHNLVHGGRDHRDAINRSNTDPQHWPGFVIFPQNKDGWKTGTNPNFGYLSMIPELIEALKERYPLDLDRIYIHGLSNGADGTWSLLRGRPDLFAAAAPMSGYSDNTHLSDTDFNTFAESMIHIPVWQFQGGIDNNPTPAATETEMTKLTNEGGTPRYTKYENLGHGVWNTAYKEPDFFSWFLQYSKLTIHSYYGVSEVCQGDPVNVKLGISKGFTEYLWQKTPTGGGAPVTVTPIDTSDPSLGNEIIADELGSYRVKFARGVEWTDWSDPFVITERSRPTVSIEALSSTALPGLDGSLDVILTTPIDEEFVYYEWFKDGVPYLDDSTAYELTVDQQGVYTLVTSLAGSCKSFVSNPIAVSLEPIVGTVPSAPDNLVGLPKSSSEIFLFWNDMSSDETAFEIWRSGSTGGPYVFAGRSPSNSLQYKDSLLSPETDYYYVIRAINNNGGSTYTSEILVTTNEDNDEPSAPANLVYVKNTINAITIAWSKPSDDEDPVDKYVINYDNTLIEINSPDTSVTVTGLISNTYYTFTVQAKDITGNISAPSNQLLASTIVCGLTYEHTLGIYDNLPDFNTIVPEFAGTTNNFGVSLANQQEYYDFRFDGFIYVPTDGIYTFYTTSDEGSALFINPNDNTNPYTPDLNQAIVDNDGLHESIERSGSIFLTAGGHPITVVFFQKTGESSLEVRYEGPGISKQLIPDSALKSSLLAQPFAPDTPTGVSAVSHPSEFQIDLNWAQNSSQNIVVLGSSTANGTGASAGNSWVELFTNWVSNNSIGSTVTNLAANGHNTFHLRADGEDGGGYTGAPDVSRNITEALSLNPDIIIVNMPSNNVADEIDLAITISHYNEFKTLAEAQSVKIFFTTTQPRNFSGGTASAMRHLLEDEANALRAQFGSNVIDIYDSLTDFNNDNRIKSLYNSGDGTHLNDLGHAYLYSQVISKVGNHFVATEIHRSNSSGGPYAIISTTNRGDLAFTDSELLSSKEYFYVLRNINADGQSAFTTGVSATTIADNVAPSIPTNVVVRSKSATKVVISWDESTDNVGVDSYKIYQEGTEVGSIGGRSLSTLAGTTKSLAFTIVGLTPSTTYSFNITALDEMTNESGMSIPIEVTTNSSTPLPVTFLDVFAVKKRNGVEINWSTASEENNAFFTVEVSHNLVNFEPLGSIDGGGNSAEIRKYKYFHSDPRNLAYYRVMQTDYDGKVSYSTIILVTYTGRVGLTLFPNPTTSDNINVQGFVDSNSTGVSIRLVDSYGKVHDRLETTPPDLIGGVRLSSYQSLTRGIYFILISDGIEVYKRKVLIE